MSECPKCWIIRWLALCRGVSHSPGLTHDFLRTDSAIPFERSIIPVDLEAPDGLGVHAMPLVWRKSWNFGLSKCQPRSVYAATGIPCLVNTSSKQVIVSSVEQASAAYEI